MVIPGGTFIPESKVAASNITILVRKLFTKTCRYATVMDVVVTRTVVVVVMLADYLPEMQRVHLITLIIMIGIVNSSARIHRQVFLSVCFNEIDRPTSRIDQGIVCLLNFTLVEGI